MYPEPRCAESPGFDAKGAWEDYFAQRCTAAGFYESVRWHEPVIRRVQHYASPPARVLEVGCGLGAPALYLSAKGHRVVALDYSGEIIRRARRMNERLEGQVGFVVMDLFHLGFPSGAFEVAYNHGVLEHFADDHVQAAVGQMLRVARTAVVSVPTWHHPVQDFGDERLLSPRQWQLILRPFRILEIYGWDHRTSPAHHLYRVGTALARPVADSLVSYWQTVWFARQVIFVLQSP